MLIKHWVTLLSLTLFPFFAHTEDWGIKNPWAKEESVAPPDIKPFELPTLQGSSPHYNTNLPALRPAPKIDPDAIFNVVLNCYPEKSKFNLELSLVAGMRTTLDEYDTGDWPEISEHYVGIVGKMPLYSSSEQSRERQWEYQRRTATATLVAGFTQALVNRNYAYRLMGLYLALEARSQQRVIKGIAGIDEQVGLLEKTAAAHRDVLASEAKIVEQRLALVAMCEVQYSQQVNSYLEQLSYLPKPTKNETNEVAQP
nr:hypothetical protein [Vibrio rarus]